MPSRVIQVVSLVFGGRYWPFENERVNHLTEHDEFLEIGAGYNEVPVNREVGFFSPGPQRVHIAE